jgi:hypothetical protein
MACDIDYSGRGFADGGRSCVGYDSMNEKVKSQSKTFPRGCVKGADMLYL